MSVSSGKQQALVVEGGQPLCGAIKVPADKSMVHRALIFAALAQGRSTIQALRPGADNVSTAAALKALGCKVEPLLAENDGALLGWEVEGVGLQGLRAPKKDVDCGNAGTAMRLLAGVLAGAGVRATLVGDASLSIRPMGRVCVPLRAMGADIQGVTAQKAEASSSPHAVEHPPIHIGPGAFAGGSHRASVASAQIKSALLLAGVISGHAVRLDEPSRSRDHTERMLHALGVPLVVGENETGAWVEFAGGSFAWDGFSVDVPGDISSAAFPLLAALAVEGSKVSTLGVGINPTRTGLLDILQQWGTPLSVAHATTVFGEDVAELVAEFLPPQAISQTASPASQTLTLGGSTIPRAIDELVVVAALAACRPGTLCVRDARELRVKESDRVAETCRLLQAFGAHCTPLEDGFVVEGGQPLHGADIDVHCDHRIAMAASVLALAAKGRSVLRGFDIADVSFPGFISTLQELGAAVDPA